MLELRVTKKDGSSTIEFPSELLDQLGVANEGIVYAAKTREGIVLTAKDVDVERQMEIAHSVMQRYDEVLRKLAQ